MSTQVEAIHWGAMLAEAQERSEQELKPLLMDFSAAPE